MRKASMPNPDFSAARGRRLLIALSGGADSVALAALLAAGREEYGFELSAAHMDHGIRPESASDAEFCRELCERLGISFYSIRVDVPAEATRTGEGLETVARRMRYAWLCEVREAVGAELIALAHHMDDQAETVLMHLARGTGPEGIGAMRTLSGALYRPLLNCRKADLIRYLTENGLEWREDRTNAVADNPRNAVRLHVLPELEKCYPQFAASAARYAKSAQIESDYLAELTRDYLNENCASGAYCQWLDLTHPPPRALLRRALRAACPAEALSWDRLNALEALCGAVRGRLDLGSRFFAERAGHRLYFVSKRVESIEPAALSLSGATAFEPLCVVSASPAPPIPIRDDPMRQAVDASALRGAVVRTRRPGDRIRPLGCGDRLLSDYLTDRKVDRPLRDAIALVAVGNRVHWACGLGISQEAALTDRTREAVLLKCDYHYGFSR